MNWIHFLLWVTGIYVTYYLVNIIMDVAVAKGVAATRSLTNELTFSEQALPQKMEHTPVAARPPDKAGSEVIASGGVALSDIFSLARQESIIYTRSVSF